MTSIAEVTEINREIGAIKAKVPDNNNAVTDWVFLSDQSTDYPAINTFVMIDFDNDDFTTGVLNAKHFSKENPPVITDGNIIYHKIGDDIVYKYDKTKRELTIDVEKLVITGDLKVVGDIEATNINASTVKASGVISGNPVEGCVES